MPERIVKRARNFSPNLYFTVSFRTMSKYKIERGDTLLCNLGKVVDSTGNILINVNREIECKVSKRDGRFYVSPELIKELNLVGVEYYEFTLNKLLKTDGSEIEIYPDELVETDIRKIKS